VSVPDLIKPPAGATWATFRQHQALDGTCRGATYSHCERYRYLLWISWDPRLPLCGFVMLNPSTATEQENDPTVERCERRAREWGYGGLVVVNLFAFRSTDPKALRQSADPVGPLNDELLVDALRGCEVIVCAWGQHGDYRSRAAKVRRLLAGKPLSALKLNGDGTPSHPLYLPYSLTPVPYPAEEVGG
jgi:hypothetical protein